MPRMILPSFSGGEVSPGLYGRVDLSKYNTSLKTCLNSFIHAHGGVSNRPGTEFIAEALGAKSRFIPFQFNVLQGYVLEFGDYVMRIIMDDGLVAHTAATTEAWAYQVGYEVDDYVENQDGDIYICILAHTASADTEPGYGVDEATYWSVVSTTDWADSTSYAVGDYVEAHTETYICTTAHTSGAADDEPGVGDDWETYWSLIDPNAWAYQVAHVVNDFVHVSDTIYRCIADHTASTSDEPGTGVNWETYWLEDEVYRCTTPYSEDDVRALKFVQSADTLFFAHPSYQPMKLTRTDHTAWVFTAQTFAPSIIAPTDLAGSYNGTGGYDVEYKVSSVSADGEESLPTSEVIVSADPSNDWEVGKYVTLTWTAEPEAVSYNIYKNANGYFGWIGTSSGTTFKDTNIEALTDDGPQEEFDGLAEADDYPSAVTFWEQRLIYGATNNQPSTVFASQTGLFNNFSTSTPLKDSDGIEATIASRGANGIRFFIPLGKLIVMTAGAEWLMTSGSSNDALTPTSLQFRAQGYRGIAEIDPLVIGQTALFVQRGGTKVRDLAYKLADDGYVGSDLTVLADHLFKGHNIVAWAYQQDPESIVWCIRDDGVMLGFTYLKEHEVWAWHRHTTDGLFLDVAVLEGDDEDATYFLTQREVDGSDVYYIEKLATRLEDEDLAKAWFVDCGLRYEGDPATVISGLGHLEGKTVAILADGSIQAQQVVTGGAITIGEAASIVLVGLPYTSDVETLRIDVNDSVTWQGATKNIPSVTLRFWNSLGGECGPDEDQLTPVYPPVPDVFGEPPELRTEDYDMLLLAEWNTRGSILFRQSDPLPFTLLAIIPEVEVGG